MPLGRWLLQLSWPELRHHPWRQAIAVLAIALGVALALSVQLINASALDEFGHALRGVQGAPDVSLRGPPTGMDDAWYDRVTALPQVAAASPVLDIDSVAVAPNGTRVPLRVLGVDALVLANLAPTLMPMPDADAPRDTAFDPSAIFLNAEARQSLSIRDAASPGTRGSLRLLVPGGSVELTPRGRIATDGPPLGVMDIAAAQTLFERVGRLSRVDIRWRVGADSATALASLRLPPDIQAVTPGADEQQAAGLSRAYRVNLMVLALVALFTGAYLVFSILALSVAQRVPHFALLGVLGMSARERLALVLAEAAVLGVLGSALGVALGTGLAATALRFGAGDLGAGYFNGLAPPLHFDVAAAVGIFVLGWAAAMAGAWVPARAAQALAPAQALKGQGVAPRQGASGRWVAALWIGGGVLATLPPWHGMPLAAYLSVGALLLGGVAGVPMVVGALLRLWTPRRHALSLLAVERARHQRHTATVAVAGVVASLALSVALTIMVSSFRVSVLEWLDTLLPADLYARGAPSLRATETFHLPPDLARRSAELPGVARVSTQRVRALSLQPGRPLVALMARPLPDPARNLPLVGTLGAAPASGVSIYASEALRDLYGARVGQTLWLPLGPQGAPVQATVRGIWRDYARQNGSLVMDSGDYQHLSGDASASDLALWLRPGADSAAVEAGVRAWCRRLGGSDALLEFSSAAEIRALTLRIFDRSFAVTLWLQAVAIGIGLFGIAASGSAQVLARQREFALLSHLGLTRAQLLTVVTAEAATWTAAGTLLGGILGGVVSVVLVKVVNPQSFHWSMDLSLPWWRLGGLCSAVMLAGTVTAWLAARAGTGRRASSVIREDG